MSKTVNLRTVRKQKAREAERKAGTERSAAAGEARRVTKLRQAEAARADRVLDGHKRDDDRT